MSKNNFVKKEDPILIKEQSYCVKPDFTTCFNENYCYFFINVCGYENVDVVIDIHGEADFFFLYVFGNRKNLLFKSESRIGSEIKYKRLSLGLILKEHDLMFKFKIKSINPDNHEKNLHNGLLTIKFDMFDEEE